MEIKFNTLTRSEIIQGDKIECLTPITFANFKKQFIDLESISVSDECPNCYHQLHFPKDLLENVLGVVIYALDCNSDTHLTFKPLIVGEEYLCVPMGADDSLYKHEKNLLTI